MSVHNMIKKGTTFYQQAKCVYQLSLRGVKLMWKESKEYTLLYYIDFVLERCIPYWRIYFSARLLDAIITKQELPILLQYTAFLLIGEVCLNLIMHWFSYAREQTHFSFYQKEQMIFGKKIMDMDYSLLEDEATHTLYQRVNRETFNDGKNLEQLRYSMPALVSHMVSMIIALVMIKDFLVSMSDQIIWVLFFVITLLGGTWISSKCSAKNEAIWLKCQNKISENCVQRDGYMNYLNNYEKGKEIRIFGFGNLLIERLMTTHHVNDKVLDERNRTIVFYDVITQFVSGISSIVIYCITVIATLMGKITLGSMTKYIQCIDNFIVSSKSIWNICIALWYNAEYLERFFTFLDIPQEMKKGCIPVEKRMDKEYKIVFEHVSFRYPNSETYALKDLNLEFKIGEKLAVVGMNGSGKTTFIKLLCRLYDPTEGTIYMNGIDIRRYQYEEYLSLFSVVFQDFKLFSFSIGENVAVEENYEESIVKTALEKAGLSEFLKEQKQGLKTVLYRDFEKDGFEVSGGEAQKIALARAIYKGAAFVLLDEPTAALDPLAEYEIYKRFNEMVADRTTVYISHRMSSCRFCGDIAVFHEGSLVQRGSHEELMQQTEGMYYQLWNSQAQYYQIG